MRSGGKYVWMLCLEVVGVRSGGSGCEMGMVPGDECSPDCHVMSYHVRGCF